MPRPHTQRDYFAELYCAGIFGDAGWAVYFPKRDVGFDFVVTKEVSGEVVLRPVQVKGLYPTETKGNKPGYGYIGGLSAVHAQMVLVLPYFAATERGAAPEQIAYMPYAELKKPSRGGYRCLPAKFEGGHAVPRREFLCYFGHAGLRAVESHNWGAGG
jgi:hypothetical protein